MSKLLPTLFIKNLPYTMGSYFVLSSSPLSGDDFLSRRRAAGRGSTRASKLGSKKNGILLMNFQNRQGKWASIKRVQLTRPCITKLGIQRLMEGSSENIANSFIPIIRRPMYDSMKSTLIQPLRPNLPH